MFEIRLFLIFLIFIFGNMNFSILIISVFNNDSRVSSIFQTEGNRRCSYDKVDVYEGDGTLLHRFCGRNLNNVKVRDKL